MPVPRMIAAAAIALVACSHARSSPTSAPAQTVQPKPAPAASPAASADTARKPEPLPRPANIYFEFDSAMLSSDARSRIESLFKEVEKRPGLHLRIEGNCDERGTSEYNLALGQRRADAAKTYLEDLGLDSSRIVAVSNGEEKPRELGHDEAAWQENRRDDLIPVRGSDGNEGVSKRDR